LKNKKIKKSLLASRCTVRNSFPRILPRRQGLLRTPTRDNEPKRRQNGMGTNQRAARTRDVVGTTHRHIAVGSAGGNATTPIRSHLLATEPARSWRPGVPRHLTFPRPHPWLPRCSRPARKKTSSAQSFMQEHGPRPSATVSRPRPTPPAACGGRRGYLVRLRPERGGGSTLGALRDLPSLLCCEPKGSAHRELGRVTMP
jgi:hypothetical protein